MSNGRSGLWRSVKIYSEENPGPKTPPLFLPPALDQSEAASPRPLPSARTGRWAAEGGGGREMPGAHHIIKPVLSFENTGSERLPHEVHIISITIDLVRHFFLFRSISGFLFPYFAISQMDTPYPGLHVIIVDGVI